MIYEEFFSEIMENHGGDYSIRTRSEYQTDEEEFPVNKKCYAIGSGQSISCDTEVNTDPLINLDLDEVAAISRKSLFQRTVFAESSSAGSKRTRTSLGRSTKAIWSAQQRMSYFPGEARTVRRG